MRSRKAITALVAVAALGVAADAAARVERAPTTVRLVKILETTPGEGSYAGRIGSERRRCRRGRAVEVIHATEIPVTIGTTRSDEYGKWKLTGDLPPDGDMVIVRAPRTKRCKGDRETYEIRR